MLSQKPNDIKRDKEIKLKLYSNCGVQEYWIVDWKLQTVEIYICNQSHLTLEQTLLDNNDVIISKLLPDFSCEISQFFT